MIQAVVVIIASVGLVWSTCIAHQEVQPSVEYRTGRALQEAIGQSVSWSGAGISSAAALRQWQLQTRVAVIRDRRLDPHHLISLQPGMSSGRQVLHQVSEQTPNAAWCETDRFVYLGPEAAAERLPILLDLQKQHLVHLRRQLTAMEVRRLTAEQPVAWERLSEPRTILLAAAESAGAQIQQPEQIPHDLWDAAVWPRMTFPELATVILNQFDLMLVPTDRPLTFQVQSVDMSIEMERSYGFRREERQDVSAAIEKVYPELAVRWAAGTMRVTASLEHHVWLHAEWRRRNPGPVSTPESDAGQPTGSILTRRFTLEAANISLGQLIESFRAEGIAVEVNSSDQAALQTLLQKQIRVSLGSVSGEEFFEQVFGPHFSSVRVHADRVVLEQGP